MRNTACSTNKSQTSEKNPPTNAAIIKTEGKLNEDLKVASFLIFNKIEASRLK